MSPSPCTSFLPRGGPAGPGVEHGEIGRFRDTTRRTHTGERPQGAPQAQEVLEERRIRRGSSEHFVSDRRGEPDTLCGKPNVEVRRLGEGVDHPAANTALDVDGVHRIEGQRFAGERKLFESGRPWVLHLTEAYPKGHYLNIYRFGGVQ
ncbi:hypothetical protein OG524_28765 [Streptomyces sp. NBC_01520]